MTLNEKVKAILDEREISHRFTAGVDTDIDAFEAGFHGRNHNFTLRILTNEKDSWIQIICFPEFHVPQKYLDRGVHSANVINNDRLFAFCHIDPADGEVAFRMGVMTDPETSKEVIERAIWTVCSASDIDSSELMEALFNNHGLLN